MPRALPLVLLLAACSSAPEIPGEPDPEVIAAHEERRQRLAEERAKARDIDRVLHRADILLDEYVTARNMPPSNRVLSKLRTLETTLTKTAREHFDELLRLANDDEAPARQSVAVALLGFDEDPRALSAIVHALQTDDDIVRNNALLAVALRQDPKTPVELITRVIEDEDARIETQACAAWALHELQDDSFEVDRIVEFWLGMLEKPISTYDPTVLLSAVRGAGASRRPELAPTVVPFVSHPVPKIREAAAIALGRMKNQQTVEPLLSLLGDAENNPNVRLAARKALQALAGGVDRKYSVKEWREVFDRGS